MSLSLRSFVFQSRTSSLFNKGTQEKVIYFSCSKSWEMSFLLTFNYYNILIFYSLTKLGNLKFISPWNANFQNTCKLPFWYPKSWSEVPGYLCGYLSHYTNCFVISTKTNQRCGSTWEFSQCMQKNSINMQTRSGDRVTCWIQKEKGRPSPS